MSIFRRKDETGQPEAAPATVPVSRDSDLAMPPFRPSGVTLPAAASGPAAPKPTAAPAPAAGVARVPPAPAAASAA
ncbi:hypothetical protein, partial [Roseomonas sp. CECT 9278]|uniref:hypothetical protein n=1 Tax=Roseomonas sp. CECT 9278 TaxID=2845823 RepID=UPI001E28691A